MSAARFAFALAAASSLALAACGESPAPEPEGTMASAPAMPGEPTSEPAPAGDTGDTPAATPGATPTEPGKVDSNPPGDECGASKVASFVAQEATPAVRARVKAEVGHDRIRWVGPDTVVTMDFRPDRLNVMLDAANVITGGKCS